jgi:two-component system sensor histidine kinase DesK
MERAGRGGEDVVATQTEQETQTQQQTRRDAQWRRPGLVRTAVSNWQLSAPGTGSPLRWVFSSIWLVYLIQPVSELFRHHHGTLWIAGGIAITVAFCVLYVPMVGNGFSQQRLARSGLVAIIVLAGLACAVYGKAWTPLWIYVSAATGMVMAGLATRRVTLLAVLGVGVLYGVFCVLSHQDMGDFLATLLPVVLIGLAMVGFRMQVDLMRELTQARETVVKLAASEERLRLARDMHDLTGQSLSMITLKAELAGKRLTRLPASPESDAIATELSDIAGVSRQTLHDIREAVSGYRRPTLAIELITARTALDAARIRVDDDPGLITRSGTFDPDAEAALAWCLREAVTNVIRHSGARTCAIRLAGRPGELTLEITDDGHGRPASGTTASNSTSTGNGLRNMSERLSAVGGHLTLSPGGAAAKGFRLAATVPMCDT